MTNANATAEVFWTAFQSLKKRDRDAVVTRLIGDKNFREDLFDLVILEQRKREPSRSLEAYLAE